MPSFSLCNPSDCGRLLVRPELRRPIRILSRQLRTSNPPNRRIALKAASGRSAKYDTERNRLPCRNRQAGARRTVPSGLGDADQVSAATVVQGCKVRHLHPLGCVFGSRGGERVVPQKHVRREERRLPRISANSTSPAATTPRVTRTTRFRSFARSTSTRQNGRSSSKSLRCAVRRSSR